jgi:exonuclease III
MPHDFLRNHDIEILFLQEVTHPYLSDLPEYVTHTNVRTSMRGTAFVTRIDLQVTNITKLPSGRRIAADCVGITLINIHATSGTAKRMERETFFTADLAYLLRNAPKNLLLGGDFNCVLETADTTGHYTYSRAVAELIQGYAMRDM